MGLFSKKIKPITAADLEKYFSDNGFAILNQVRKAFKNQTFDYSEFEKWTKFWSDCTKKGFDKKTQKVYLTAFNEYESKEKRMILTYKHSPQYFQYSSDKFDVFAEDEIASKKRNTEYPSYFGINYKDIEVTVPDTNIKQTVPVLLIKGNTISLVPDDLSELEYPKLIPLVNSGVVSKKELFKVFEEDCIKWYMKSFQKYLDRIYTVRRDIINDHIFNKVREYCIVDSGIYKYDEKARAILGSDVEDEGEFYVDYRPLNGECEELLSLLLDKDDVLVDDNEKQIRWCIKYQLDKDYQKRIFNLELTPEEIEELPSINPDINQAAKDHYHKTHHNCDNPLWFPKPAYKKIIAGNDYIKRYKEGQLTPEEVAQLEDLYMRNEKYNKYLRTELNFDSGEPLRLSYLEYNTIVKDKQREELFTDPNSVFQKRGIIDPTTLQGIGNFDIDKETIEKE